LELSCGLSLLFLWFLSAALTFVDRRLSPLALPLFIFAVVILFLFLFILVLLLLLLLNAMAHALICTDDLLDRVFIAYFETLVELRAVRTQFAAEMKAGFFEMARARVQTMTNQQVCSLTPLHYDMNMKATVRLFPCFPAPDDPSELPSLALTAPAPATSSDSAQAPLAVETETETDGLRHRHHPRELSDPSTVVADSHSAPPRPRDPLFWFGPAPTQSLRVSQRHFRRSVSLAVQIGHLQLRLRGLEARFLQRPLSPSS
jgi:hypothetical protein